MTREETKMKNKNTEIPIAVNIEKEDNGHWSLRVLYQSSGAESFECTDRVDLFELLRKIFNYRK